MKKCLWLIGIITLTLLFVAVDSAHAQLMQVVPRDTKGQWPHPFLDACYNPDQWPNVRARTVLLGGGIGSIAAADDGTLAGCFATMHAVGLQLAPGGAGFGVCGLGNECFDIVAPMLVRFRDLGAPAMRYRIDEPLTQGKNMGWAFDDIVFQTCNFVWYMRTYLPDVGLTLQEAYPHNSAEELSNFVGAVNNLCWSWGVAPPDIFELDHDTNASGWSWTGVWALNYSAHSIGWYFSYIFGSPVPPGSTWHDTVLSKGYWMHLYGIVPDLYAFDSFENTIDPPYTVPEWTWYAGGPFMGTVNYFRMQGYFPW